LAQAMELNFLFIVPRIFFYIALLAWLATFAGLVYTLTAKLIGSLTVEISQYRD
jgi:hypothetical protein